MACQRREKRRTAVPKSTSRRSLTYRLARLSRPNIPAHNKVQHFFIHPLGIVFLFLYFFFSKECVYNFSVEGTGGVADPDHFDEDEDRRFYLHAYLQGSNKIKTNSTCINFSF